MTILKEASVGYTQAISKSCNYFHFLGTLNIEFYIVSSCKVYHKSSIWKCNRYADGPLPSIIPYDPG